MIVMKNGQGEAVARRGLEELSVDELELNDEGVYLVHLLIQNESDKNKHNESSLNIIKILKFFLVILYCPTIMML